MRSKLLFARLLSVLCLAGPGLMPSGASAATLPERFTLGRYLPGDVWFYVHAVHNPEREWLESRWAEIFEALHQAGIGREVGGLFLSMMEPEKRKEIEPKLDRVLNALRSVNWTELCGSEFVMAQRLSSCQRGNDYILLVRPKPDTVDQNFSALTAILKEISTAGPGIRVVESDQGPVRRVALKFEQKEAADLGLAIELFRTSEVVGFCTGEQSAHEVVDMLAGRSKDRSLVAGSRFQQAIENVQPPTDSLVFFDGRQFLGALQVMIETNAKVTVRGDSGEKRAPTPQESAEFQNKARPILKEVFSHLDVIDYSVESTVTKGRTERADSVMMLQPGKKDSPLAAAFLDRRQFEQFDRFIPVDAQSFSLAAGIDAQRLYRLVLSFAGEHVPKLAAGIAQVQAKLGEIGFDIERDFLSWWSGETISVELPAAMVTPMGGSDSVTMIRVKDRELAAAKVNEALEFIVAKLKTHGQVLSVTPAMAVKEPGFREITYPALAMLVRPVIGVHEDWLMIGTSASAINKCLAVAAGEAPSISKDAQFAEEGVTPKGPVLSASFEDLSRKGAEMAAFAGMVGTFGQMGVMQMPESDPQARKIKQTLISLLKIAAKLGPVLQKIDFYSSSSGATTYDGDSTVRFTRVTTYKPQPVVAKNKKAK